MPAIAGEFSSMFIRLDKWNSLPPEVRNLLIKAGKDYEKALVEYVLPYHKENYWPLIRKAGVKEIVLTKEEQKEFKKRLEPVWDWWKGLLPPGVGEKAIKLATE
ncbi:MAG: hypothetical protein FD151_2376 [bacterium]|nr:MAG: hypothetical protein FD151_2376 [bacterium]